MAQWRKVVVSGSIAELNHVSASGDILPVSDNVSSLGSAGQEFKDLFLDGTAHIDSAQIDSLGAALDANNQAITNIDVNSGAIDGTPIGANTHTTIKGTTIDATTDFTIGGTVITDNTITDDGDFTMNLAGDLLLDVITPLTFKSRFILSISLFVVIFIISPLTQASGDTCIVIVTLSFIFVSS